VRHVQRVPRQRRDRGDDSAVARHGAGGATVYDAFSTLAEHLAGTRPGRLRAAAGLLGGSAGEL